MSFINGTHEKPVEGPTRVWVKKHGKKFKATFCFSQRKMTKIVTAERLAELKADGRYSVI